MYKEETQLAFEDFVFPFGELDSENEWVKLAGLIPWDTVERAYAKQFVDNGHPAHSARIALGALLIKQRLKCSDEWTVRHVSENPYLQFFLGMKAYSSKAPFGASTMVEFRKRFPPEAIATILEASIPKKPRQDHDDQGKPGGSSGQKAAQSEPETPSNSGTLLMDSTCCPADIAFPQDFQLLNHARELLEDMVRETCNGQWLEDTPDVLKDCAKVFPEPVQEQKTICQGHSEVHQAATAVHPPRYRIHRGLHPKQGYPA